MQADLYQMNQLQTRYMSIQDKFAVWIDRLNRDELLRQRNEYYIKIAGMMANPYHKEIPKFEINSSNFYLIK